MKHTLFVFTLFAFKIYLVSSGGWQILSTLQMGEYQIHFNEFKACGNQAQKNKILFNLYLSQSSDNRTIIRGNLTNKIPYDDSLNMDLNLAIKHPTEGWKENSFVHKSPKACTAIKNMMGNSFGTFTKAFGLRPTCPLPVGVYTTTGFDPKILSDGNYPKTFFYATFKVRLSLMLKKEVVGCSLSFVELKPV